MFSLIDLLPIVHVTENPKPETTVYLNVNECLGQGIGYSVFFSLQKLPGYQKPFTAHFLILIFYYFYILSEGVLFQRLFIMFSICGFKFFLIVIN